MIRPVKMDPTEASNSKLLHALWCRLGKISGFVRPLARLTLVETDPTPASAHSTWRISRKQMMTSFWQLRNRCLLLGGDPLPQMPAQGFIGASSASLGLAPPYISEDKLFEFFHGDNIDYLCSREDLAPHHKRRRNCYRSAFRADKRAPHSPSTICAPMF